MTSSTNVVRQLLCIFSYWTSVNSWYLIYYLVCEFTAHHACKNAEINLKSTTTNRFNLWIINSLMESWGVHLTWLDCKLIVFLCKLYCMLNLSGIDRINRRIRYKTNSGSCSQIRGMKYSWTSLKLPPWGQKNVLVLESQCMKFLSAGKVKVAVVERCCRVVPGCYGILLSQNKSDNGWFTYHWVLNFLLQASTKTWKRARGMIVGEAGGGRKRGKLCKNAVYLTMKKGLEGEHRK